MDKKISIDAFFRMPETNQPQELVYGYVHEPPMPAFGHSTVLLRLAELLRAHVREYGLGTVGMADVVLDREAALVVQPDLFFVSAGRLGIVEDQVWGAPDLVIEIASPSTEHRDRTLKLAWYQKYGVRECWLVYPKDRRIEVVDCTTNKRDSFAGTEALRSNVLGKFSVPAKECFD